MWYLILYLELRFKSLRWPCGTLLNSEDKLPSPHSWPTMRLRKPLLLDMRLEVAKGIKAKQYYLSIMHIVRITFNAYTPTSSTDYLLPEFGYNLCHELMIYGFTTTKNQLFQMASLIITCLIWSSYYYITFIYSALCYNKLFPLSR